jgi:hypothetical protein
MSKQILKVISPPKEGTCIVLTARDATYTVVIRGRGDIDLICGNCFSVLAEEVQATVIENFVLLCSKCGSYNELLSVH